MFETLILASFLLTTVNGAFPSAPISYLTSRSPLLDDLVNSFNKTKSSTLCKNFPQSLDARNYSAFVNCSAIISMTSEAICDNHYAIAVVSMLNDRICIQSKGKTKTYLSIRDAKSCDREGKCNIGQPEDTLWLYYHFGITTGHPTNASVGCKPGPVAGIGEKCQSTCDAQFTGSNYWDAKYFGDVGWKANPSNCQIKTEIFVNGPVVSEIKAYPSLLSYTWPNLLQKLPTETSSAARALPVKVIGWDSQAWIVVVPFANEGITFVRIKQGDSTFNFGQYAFAAYPNTRDRAIVPPDYQGYWDFKRDPRQIIQ